MEWNIFEFGVFFLSFCLLFLLLDRVSKKIKTISKKDKERLANLKTIVPQFADKHGFVSVYYEDYGDMKVQVFGTVVGSEIQQGDTLALGGGTLKVGEIFADRHNPEYSSVSAEPGSEDVALLVQLQYREQLEAFRSSMSSNGVIFLESTRP